MGVGWAIGNAVLAPKVYDNWAEVIAASFKRHEPAKVILKNGLIIEAEASLRYLVREIFFEGVYTPPYLPIGNDDIVVDIGANNGVFTLFAASITRNSVHAFEPAPQNLEVLRRNIAVNRLSNIIVHGCAVSERVGVAKLFLHPSDGQQNLLSDHIIPDKLEQYKTHTVQVQCVQEVVQSGVYAEVPTTSLQEFMNSNNLEQIDFLKLDCEGAEGTILLLTPDNYLKRIRKIAMEFHDQLSEFSHNDIQNRLEKAGFTTRLKLFKQSPVGYMYAWRS